jgi:hypothetical protein
MLLETELAEMPGVATDALEWMIDEALTAWSGEKFPVTKRFDIDVALSFSTEETEYLCSKGAGFISLYCHAADRICCKKWAEMLNAELPGIGYELMYLIERALSTINAWGPMMYLNDIEFADEEYEENEILDPMPDFSAFRSIQIQLSKLYTLREDPSLHKIAECANSIEIALRERFAHCDFDSEEMCSYSAAQICWSENDEIGYSGDAYNDTLSASGTGSQHVYLQAFSDGKSLQNALNEVSKAINLITLTTELIRLLEEL